MPMLRDRFDQLILLGLVLVLAAVGGLVVTAGSGRADGRPAGVNKQLEREIASQARIAFLQRYYEPVEGLRDAGELQAGLLKLEELDRKFPGEAHGALLRGELLFQMGVADRAVLSLADAVRHNGDYVDAASPLNRRGLIETVVAESLPQLRDRARTQPDNADLALAVKQVYYLQSRLAGGCE